MSLLIFEQSKLTKQMINVLIDGHLGSLGALDNNEIENGCVY